MNLTTETRIVLTDLGGRSARFLRYEDGSVLVESAANVALRAQNVDDLVRFLRPDLLPPRFTAQQSGGTGTGNWFVFDGTARKYVSHFNLNHPDPEGSARTEADRLNETETP